MALAHLSIYYTWKNIKSEYNNNKFNISAPTWNDTFDLIYQMVLIQCLILKITLNLSSKKHKTLTENPPAQIYTNKILKRIVFKIKTAAN